MRIPHLTISLLFLLLMSLYAYPQKDKSLQHLFGYEGYSLDRNQVQFNQPKDLIFYADTLRKYDVYLGCLLAKESKRFPNSYCRTFMSRDSDFIVFAAIPGIYCKRNDSLYADFELSDMKVEMESSHLSNIKGDFIKNIGKRDISLSDLPLTYKSSKFAREAFNADTVITYPLKMWEKFEDKYTHCLVMVLQKRYRGMIFFYCLYTDEGSKKLDYYLQLLEKVFWYRNPKDYIEVKEREIIDEYVIPLRKVPPGTMVGCI